MSEHPLSEKKPAQLPYPAEKAEVGLSQRSEVGFIRAGLTQSEARLALSLSERAPAGCRVPGAAGGLTGGAPVANEESDASDSV